MAVISINTDPTRRQLNLFGCTWVIFFGVLTALLWRRLGMGPWVPAAGAGAVVVPFVGWLWPTFMTAIPPAKSINSRPSTSRKMAPCADWMKLVVVIPTPSEMTSVFS